MSDCTELKISHITLEGHRIGLRNLEDVFANVRSRDISTEEELKRALVEETRDMKNYIPASAEAKYETALLREYRRFLGEPCEEAEEEGLTVRVLGMGCPICRRLTEEVMAALTELKLAADVEHVTDVNQIAEYGAVGTPALVINKKMRSVGKVPARNRIKRWLEEEAGAKKDR